MKAHACLPLLLLVASSPSGAQDVCAADETLAVGGPVGISFFEGDTGRPRHICPRTELSLAGAGVFDDVVDDLSGTDGNFYATIQGGAEIAGSYRLNHRLELFCSLQGLLFRFVQNATLTDTHLGPGWTTAGATYTAHRAQNLALGLTTRLTLPTALGYNEHMWPVAADLGLLGAWRPLGPLWVHAQLGALASFALGPAPADARAALLVMAGAEYAPCDWFSPVLDLSAQFGYRDPLDILALSPGLRFRIWRGLATELAASIPVAGGARANFGALLRLSYDFER